MERKMMASLLSWKISQGRKPLLFQGARQVGKTWLLKEFGRLHYRNVAYVNFDLTPSARGIFEGDFELAGILTRLQLITGQSILPGESLIILDEIQESPRAVSCLKYFCELGREYHVAAAGSYLGVASLEGTGFPVGKVNTLTLHPMSFLEFLAALGEEGLVRCLEQRDWVSLALLRERLIEHLRYYQIVGGMPEVVESFARWRDFLEVRKIQKGLLAEYDRDFGKHTPHGLVPNIRMVWHSIPSQLSKENKKYILSQLHPRARKESIGPAIQWLCDAGLLTKVLRVSKPAFPLSAYGEQDVFKLFFLDIGLMTALSDLSPKIILEGNRIFTEFKGAMAEQYVLQELLAECDLTPFYWATNSNELDFLFSFEDGIVPLEVKAETNVRSRSLMCFCRKYRIPFAVRSSLLDYRVDWTETLPFKQETEGETFQFLLANLPLYAISQIPSLCQNRQ
ncbi:MAG: ATP-binding protein [Oligosphaeraceae bacterium]